ncbi:sulfotransferase [Chromatiales bacterium (ex Bugula neritina AB1)]|nr:sulfotransferase [Chromatiales bacterium (ex Bugula neritina AB1)]
MSSAGRYDSYIICTSPRSGSTLLCDLLANTGIAGKPESYFHKPSIESWLAHHNLASGDTIPERRALELIFNAAVSAGTSGTGIFGLRLQWPSLDFFAKKLAVLHPQPRGDKQRLNAAFGTVAFIHLTRVDKVDQAVSLVKAEQTGLWHRAADGSELERLSPPQAPVYDTARIAACFNEVTQSDQNWVQWFAREQIDTLRVTYEALAADPAETLGHLLAYLKLDSRAAVDVVPGVMKLADETSQNWVERFREEKSNNAG